MSDALGIAGAVGVVVTAIGSIMGGVFAYRTSKMNTDLAARKLDMEDDASVVLQWQKLADERKAELVIERERVAELQRRFDHMRSNCNRHCERAIPDDPPPGITIPPTAP